MSEFAMIQVLLCRVGMEPTVETVPNDDPQPIWDLLDNPQEEDVEQVVCTLGPHDVMILRGLDGHPRVDRGGPVDYDYVLVGAPDKENPDRIGDLDDDDIALLREVIAHGVHPYGSPFGNLIHRLVREREVTHE